MWCLSGHYVYLSKDINEKNICYEILGIKKSNTRAFYLFRDILRYDQQANRSVFKDISASIVQPDVAN